MPEQSGDIQAMIHHTTDIWYSILFQRLFSDQICLLNQRSYKMKFTEAMRHEKITTTAVKESQWWYLYKCTALSLLQ